MQGGSAEDPARELDVHNGAFGGIAHIRKTASRPFHERTAGNRGGPSEGQTAAVCRDAQRADGQSFGSHERPRKVTSTSAYNSHLRMRSAYSLGIHGL